MDGLDRRRGLAVMLRAAAGLGAGLGLRAVPAAAQMNPRSRPCIPTARPCATPPAAGRSARPIVGHGR